MWAKHGKEWKNTPPRSYDGSHNPLEPSRPSKSAKTLEGSPFTTTELLLAPTLLSLTLSTIDVSAAIALIVRRSSASDASSGTSTAAAASAGDAAGMWMDGRDGGGVGRSPS